MLSSIELRNRINEYRERAVELQSAAPHCQSEETRDAMLYFADGYEFMADTMENSQEAEERPLLN
jgi:hypothetical protein